jgi:hypothetical protein
MSSTDPDSAAAAAAAAAAAFQQFTIEAFTLLAIGICFTVLRTAARIKIVGIKGLQWDDFLVWVGTVGSACSSCPVFTVSFLHLRYAMPPRQVSPTLSVTLLKGLPTTA